MTEIRDPLYEAAEISRHEPAILCGSRRLLYYEFDEIVAETAWKLDQAGIGAGDRVAIHLETGWEYLVLLMALFRVGAIVCPLNTRLPVHGVQAQLDRIRCGMLIVRCLGDWDGLQRVVVAEVDNVVSGSIGGPRIDGNRPVAIERPATIVFTSGSTGDPRAVLHTVGNHYYSARGSNINIKVGSHDRWMLTLPLYHVGGLGVLFRCIIGGATIVIPDPGESIVDAQERFEATHISMVSTQLRRMLTDGLIPPSFLNLKAILLGGGPIDQALLEEAMRRKLPVYPSYGLTEMTSQVTTVQPTSPPERRLSAGLPLKYREMKLSAEGEILVRGPVLCAGYVDGDDVNLPLDAEGWFATGDLGDLDVYGGLVVTGRKDNMFVSGGENIQPEEIECALMAIDGVEEACVVPVPDEEFGHRPAAFVRFRNGGADAAAINRRLEKTLPRYKLPVRYLAWPEAARQGLKPSRAELQAEARSHA